MNNKKERQKGGKERGKKSVCKISTSDGKAHISLPIFSLTLGLFLPTSPFPFSFHDDFHYRYFQNWQTSPKCCSCEEEARPLSHR